jgi:hypothetical protein
MMPSSPLWFEDPDCSILSKDSVLHELDVWFMVVLVGEFSGWSHINWGEKQSSFSSSSETWS